MSALGISCGTAGGGEDGSMFTPSLPGGVGTGGTGGAGGSSVWRVA